MTPQDQNFLGYVFGGVILKMMDQIAYIAAAKHCNNNCVTASFDRVDFKDHIYVGEIVVMEASVNYVGHTSMEVGIKVYAENPKTGKIRHTNSSYVTMVAIDGKGHSKKVPGLILKTSEEKRRFAEGKKRYQERKNRTSKKVVCSQPFYEEKIWLRNAAQP
jgi:acyl-CoA hydrolase